MSFATKLAILEHMDWIVSKTVQVTARMGFVTMSTVLAFATDLLFAVTEI